MLSMFVSSGLKDVEYKVEFTDENESFVLKKTFIHKKSSFKKKTFISFSKYCFIIYLFNPKH